jgi:hypothetical protein
MSDKMDERKHRVFILINIIRYAIGAFFLFVGAVLLFQGEMFPGISSILLSIISTPEIADPIENKLNVTPSTFLRFIVMLLLLMIISVTHSPLKPQFPM